MNDVTIAATSPVTRKQRRLYISDFEQTVLFVIANSAISSLMQMKFHFNPLKVSAVCVVCYVTPSILIRPMPGKVKRLVVSWTLALIMYIAAFFIK